MNIYIVTEGPTEKKVYSQWIPVLNRDLTFVWSIDDVQDNNFHIISSEGYPTIFKSIKAAIEDINDLDRFDRLVVVVDSEEMSLEEKRKEFEDFIKQYPCKADVYIIVQHFCFETWPLANWRCMPRKPHNATLYAYKKFYDVTRFDPEQLPPYVPENLSRVTFALKYLKLGIRDRYDGLSYTKQHPNVVCQPKYFSQILSRHNNTGHIPSFSEFIRAFT